MSVGKPLFGTPKSQDNFLDHVASPFLFPRYYFIFLLSIFCHRLVLNIRLKVSNSGKVSEDDHWSWQQSPKLLSLNISCKLQTFSPHSALARVPWALYPWDANESDNLEVQVQIMMWNKSQDVNASQKETRPVSVGLLSFSLDICCFLNISPTARIGTTILRDSMESSST